MPAYTPQQTAYIQPCTGQFSYNLLLIKKKMFKLIIVEYNIILSRFQINKQYKIKNNIILQNLIRI